MLSTSIDFPLMIVGPPRAFVRTKNENEEVALDNKEQGRSGCESNFDQVDGKRRRAIGPPYTLQPESRTYVAHVALRDATVPNIVGCLLF